VGLVVDGLVFLLFQPHLGTSDSIGVLVRQSLRMRSEEARAKLRRIQGHADRSPVRAQKVTGGYGWGKRWERNKRGALEILKTKLGPK